MERLSDNVADVSETLWTTSPRCRRHGARRSDNVADNVSVRQRHRLRCNCAGLNVVSDVAAFSLTCRRHSRRHGNKTPRCRRHCERLLVTSLVTWKQEATMSATLPGSVGDIASDMDTRNRDVGDVPIAVGDIPCDIGDMSATSHAMSATVLATLKRHWRSWHLWGDIGGKPSALG